jgi:hypothetical protein
MVDDQIYLMTRFICSEDREPVDEVPIEGEVGETKPSAE